MTMWSDQGLCAVRGEETLRTLKAWVGWGLVGKDGSQKRQGIVSSGCLWAERL